MAKQSSGKTKDPCSNRVSEKPIFSHSSRSSKAYGSTFNFSENEIGDKGQIGTEIVFGNDTRIKLIVNDETIRKCSKLDRILFRDGTKIIAILFDDFIPNNRKKCTMTFVRSEIYQS